MAVIGHDGEGQLRLTIGTIDVRFRDEPEVDNSGMKLSIKSVTVVAIFVLCYFVY